MALARTWSVGLAGVQGAMVEVEVDLAPGVPTVVLGVAAGRSRRLLLVAA
jgi:hypothetical protein